MPLARRYIVGKIQLWSDFCCQQEKDGLQLESDLRYNCLKCDPTTAAAALLHLFFEMLSYQTTWQFNMNASLHFKSTASMPSALQHIAACTFLEARCHELEGG